MEIKERSPKKIFKLSANHFSIRTTAPRFQKQSKSPKRFKLIPNSICSPSNKTFKSASASPERCESQINSSNAEKIDSITKSPSQPTRSDFLPNIKTRVYISEPDTSTQVKRSPTLGKHEETSSLLSSFHLKSSENHKKRLESFKQDCKILQSKIITETQLNKSELLQAQSPKRTHPLSNDYFKEVKLGNYLAVQTLLVMNPELITEADSTLQTSLHWAVKRKDSKLVKLLLSSGARWNVFDSVGRTAEMLAKKCENQEIVKIFQDLIKKSKAENDESNDFQGKCVGINNVNSLRTWFRRKRKAIKKSNDE
jgi:hypothetical protein